MGRYVVSIGGRYSASIDAATNAAASR